MENLQEGLAYRLRFCYNIDTTVSEFCASKHSIRVLTCPKSLCLRAFFVLLHLSIDAHYQILQRGFPGNTSTKYDDHTVIVSKSTHYEFLQILVGAFFIRVS